MTDAAALARALLPLLGHAVGCMGESRCDCAVADAVYLSGLPEADAWALVGRDLVRHCLGCTRAFIDNEAKDGTHCRLCLEIMES